MITRLHIVNFILAEEITINFDEGLNVLTGETGAGKSIIVGALDYILGKQIRTDLSFDNSKDVYLEAQFLLSPYTKEKTNINNKEIEIEQILGYNPFNDASSPSIDANFPNRNNTQRDLVISREINQAGKSFSRLNGQRISLKQINELRKVLLDFHSQRDQMLLFDNQYQLQVLDSWLNIDKEKQEYSALYNELKHLIEKKKKLEIEERKRAEKYSLYQYQVEELEKLNLKKDEGKDISDELDLFTHSEEILTICSEMQNTVLEQENSMLDVFGSFKQRLNRIGSDNKQIKAIVSNLDTINEMLISMQFDIKLLQDSIDIDASRMTYLEERLSEIIRIKNKYKMDVTGIINYLDEIKTALQERVSRANEIEQMQDSIGKISKKLLDVTELLSTARKEAALPFAIAVINDLTELSIQDGVFSVDITSIGKICINDGMISGLNETGNDRVEYLFSANKGLAPQKLKDVVSGGELSRLLLIIKKILASRFESPTLVLDEIDSGIGGKTATKMGKYISIMAENHQIICITHLPQIASFADKQFLIQKLTGLHKPLIEVKELTSEERREEIARMLSGSKSEIALKHADEILNNY